MGRPGVTLGRTRPLRAILPGLVSEYYELGNLRNFVRPISPSVQERTRIKLVSDLLKEACTIIN